MNDAQYHKKYWVGFNVIHGVGPSRLRGLYSYFQHDLAVAWHADARELQRAGLPDTVVEEVIERRRKLNLNGMMERLAELGAKVCTLDDPDYPVLLAETPDAPALFYYRGYLAPDESRALAIVGTRRSTSYGQTVTQELTTALVQAGVTIVSGLALGIDAIAHQAALDAGGRTIAVLANGIDDVYPPEHKHLAEAITEYGAVITEYPPRTPPDAKHFPARNRIISGLSLGVLVVEAPAKSGALLTATVAAEQGREVFAVPGHIISPNSRGTNRLIQEGAILVTRAEDILEELNLSHQLVQTRQEIQSMSPEDETEQMIIRLLANEALHIDEIVIQSGLSISEASAKLLMMSLKGMVKEIHPMVYGLVQHLN